MAKRFAVQQYLQPTRANGPDAIMLVTRLVKAAPKRLPERVKAGLIEMREQGVHLQDVLMDRLRDNPISLRPLDLRLDGGWMGLFEAFAASARLEGTPAAKEAIVLIALVFPQGTAFVKATYAAEWTTSANTLRIIDENELEPRIKALVGGQFLPFIRESHRAFGDALGVGEGSVPTSEEDTASLADALDRVTDAIAEYGRLMVGWLDWDDPEKVAAFRRAMAPLDAHRRAIGASHASEDTTEAAPVPTGEEIDDPTTPIPPVASDTEPHPGA
jgi:hypothetical protein